ncbi:DnaT-like ssDNA-binding domain-containing protein [Pseudomonas sp. Irchel s3a18]|uniref:DnaT-like ssDNA-binding domain-containing protein n=1 Tax=Pseudomonas sp. Irchel s3a18 TaxID=2009053 RepID=UPI000BA3CCBD|nr:DnaT-like ssDNA-binding domain-containing protein [Pseudomonas sp. Irchel s3a18]
MARIRTIKPEFWTSEQVMECSALARLLFIGIWNFCDDAGNHPLSPKSLKALVFPGDDITALQISDLLAELESNGLLSVYSYSSKQYLHVNGWHHQKIDKPTIKHPSFVIDVADESSSPRPPLGERSTSDMGALTPGVEGEGKGNGESTHTPRGLFAMSLDWAPDVELLNAYSTRAGLNAAVFTQDAISGFVLHHEAKGLAQTEKQWIAALVGWVKRDNAKAARVVPLRARQVNGPDFDDTSWSDDLGAL